MSPEKRKDRSYSFTVSSFGRFTNNSINSNALKLAEIFSKRPSFFDKNNEFIATDRDFILTDALMCCLSVALDLESFRSYFIAENKKFVSKNIYQDIGMFLFLDDEDKRLKIQQLVLEIFIVRDAIVHAHKHKVKVQLKDYRPIKASVHVSPDALSNQGDNKYSQNVSVKTKKTRMGKFNVTLPKISFLDALKMFIILDLIDKYTPQSQLDMAFWFDPSHFDLYRRAEWGPLASDLTFIILYFINETSPTSYVFTELEKFVKEIEKIFSDVPHGPFKKYRLYEYKLWQKWDFLKYDSSDLRQSI